MIITPALKDEVLTFICQSMPLEGHNGFNPSDGQIDFDILYPILAQFERMGFISDLNARRVAIFMTTHLEAHDYLARGGFTAQEELLKKNIEKLLLEIESLKPSMPDKVQAITSIAGNIATALGLFLK